MTAPSPSLAVLVEIVAWLRKLESEATALSTVCHPDAAIYKLTAPQYKARADAIEQAAAALGLISDLKCTSLAQMSLRDHYVRAARTLATDIAERKEQMSVIDEAWVCSDCGGGSNAHRAGCKQDRRAQGDLLKAMEECEGDMRKCERMIEAWANDPGVDGPATLHAIHRIMDAALSRLTAAREKAGFLTPPKSP